MEKDKLIICGINFTKLGFPREFDGAERRLFRNVAEKHDYFDISRQYFELEGKNAFEQVNTGTLTLRKKAGAVEKQLQKEYDKDVESWDMDKQDSLETKLAEVMETLKSAELGTFANTIKENKELQSLQEQFLEKQETVYLEVVHHLLGDDAPDFKEFQAQATGADHDAAAEVVEGGLKNSPLNRAQRRAMKAGKSDDSLSA